jgi:hypothetical protein
MSDAILLKGRLPVRTKMSPDCFYEMLDPGIRFAVRVLHARGIETAQSCEGGEGHAYEHPTVDLCGTGGRDSEGFAALHVLEEYGLEVYSVVLHWNVARGLPCEGFWRISLRRAWPERADEKTMFIYGYQARPDD